jgi:Tfp pilus assembly protein PilV
MVNRDEGFTLLEVLIATGLMATSVISLAHLFVLATQAHLGSRAMTFGTLLASQKIEQLRSAAFSGGPAQGEDAVDGYGQLLEGGAVVPAFRRTWTVTPLPSHPSQAVVVTVVVSSATDANRAVRLTTIRSRRQ